MERFVRMAEVAFIIAGAVNVAANYAWNVNPAAPWMLLIGGWIMYLVGEAEQDSMNINECVWVRLTPAGEKIWNDDWKRLSRYTGSVGVPDSVRKAVTEDDQTVRFQLWDFMKMFGPHISMGMPSLFVDGEVIFERKASPAAPLEFDKWWESTNNKNWFSNKPITLKDLEETARFAWRAARL